MPLICSCAGELKGRWEKLNHPLRWRHRDTEEGTPLLLRGYGVQGREKRPGKEAFHLFKLKQMKRLFIRRISQEISEAALF